MISTRLIFIYIPSVILGIHRLWDSDPPAPLGTHGLFAIPPAGMMMPPANNVCLFRQMGELGWAAAWYQAVTKTKHTSWHGSLPCASGSLLPTGDMFLCAHSKAVYAAHPWVQVCWMSKGPS